VDAGLHDCLDLKRPLQDLADFGMVEEFKLKERTFACVPAFVLSIRASQLFITQVLAAKVLVDDIPE
jgi:hypothetical protein